MGHPLGPTEEERHYLVWPRFPALKWLGTLWLQGTWRSRGRAGDYIERLGLEGDAFSLPRDGGELT